VGNDAPAEREKPETSQTVIRTGDGAGRKGPGVPEQPEPITTEIYDGGGDWSGGMVVAMLLLVIAWLIRLLG
jgi:hypothetical protein